MSIVNKVGGIGCGRKGEGRRAEWEGRGWGSGCGRGIASCSGSRGEWRAGNSAGEWEREQLCTFLFGAGGGACPGPGGVPGGKERLREGERQRSAGGACAASSERVPGGGFPFKAGRVIWGSGSRSGNSTCCLDIRLRCQDAVGRWALGLVFEFLCCAGVRRWVGLQPRAPEVCHTANPGA